RRPRLGGWEIRRERTGLRNGIGHSRSSYGVAPPDDVLLDAFLPPPALFPAPEVEDPLGAEELAGPLATPLPTLSPAAAGCTRPRWPAITRSPGASRPPRTGVTATRPLAASPAWTFTYSLLPSRR